VRVSDALKRRGLSISPAGVRCVWQRHDLASMGTVRNFVRGWA
jgi:hypothetical protein